LASALADQAEGLRRLFGADTRRMVAIVSAGEGAACETASNLAYTLSHLGKKSIAAR